VDGADWRLRGVSWLIALAILVAIRRFLGMGGVGSRSLRFTSYVRMQHFVRRTT
jgi:hypothetical protein